jgi:hypothetical protein
MKNFSILLVIAIIISFGLLNAEEEDNARIGLSALIASNSMDISFPFWLSNHSVFAPSLMASYAQNAVTNIGIGFKVRFYTSKKENNIAGKLLPYFGLGIDALITIPQTNQNLQKTGTYFDMLYGGSFGGEYFISNHFSVGVEAQLNFVQSDSKSSNFGNPGNLNINTATGAFITIYF